MKIDTVHFSNVRPADWRTTHILKPDLRTLAQGILRDGWNAPIVVRSEDSTIIDGFARWVVAQNDKKVLKRDDGKIPVLWKDVDQIEAMLMHIRMNRARGFVVPRFLSMTFRDLMRSKKYEVEALCKQLGIGAEEFTLLASGDLFVQRNIAEHEYSKAWVPVESNGNDVPTFERPATPDG